jgi:Protein of unknown function (DUF998)
MKIPVQKWFSNPASGMAAFVIFTVCTLTAVALYPTPYNPLYDWLSNLGNVNFNPVGAYFFNGGCILTGIVMVPFFISLRSWYDDVAWRKVLVIVGQAAGIFTAIALIEVGIFSETHIAEHMLAAGLLFKSLFILLILFNIALFRHPAFMHGLAYYGLLVILIDLSFVWILFRYKDILGQFTPTMPVPGLEWTTVFASLAWIGALSWIMVKRDL